MRSFAIAVALGLAAPLAVAEEKVIEGKDAGLDTGTALSFRIESPKAELVEIEATYACDEASAGSEVEVACGGSKIVFKVFPAKEPLTLPVGLISLPAGPAEIVLRASKKPEGAKEVLRLRSLTLRSGFVPLFDGKSLDGWHGPGKTGYELKDGAMVCPKQGGGNLYTDREYGDFDFRFEFLLTPGANNGLGIRTPDSGDAAYVGMELQILDDGHPSYAGIAPWQAHGSIYDVVPAKRGFLRKTGEWNVEQVIAKGDRIQVILNGTTIVDADIGPHKGKKSSSGHDHPGLDRQKGFIGFLGHGAHLEFRNIRIRELGE